MINLAVDVVLSIGALLLVNHGISTLAGSHHRQPPSYLAHGAAALTAATGLGLWVWNAVAAVPLGAQAATPLAIGGLLAMAFTLPSRHPAMPVRRAYGSLAEPYRHIPDHRAALGLTDPAGAAAHAPLAGQVIEGHVVHG